MQRRSRMKYSAGDRVYQGLNMVYLWACLLVVILPLINIVSCSISDPASVLAGKVFLMPLGIDFSGYARILNSSAILNGFGISILITLLGTVISVALTIMAAYPLARRDLAGRRVILWYFTFTMLFSGGLIPTYLVIMNLGLIDNLMALILPNAVGVWNIIITRTFFMNTIPDELYEAATIDGCSDIKTLVRIVLPLSKSIMAVMVLLYAVGIWNTYFDALIYLQTQSRFPLQLVLRNILITSQMQAAMLEKNVTDASKLLAQSEVLKYAVIVFSSLPLLLLYPFIQKHFVKGMMVGAIKG